MRLNFDYQKYNMFRVPTWRFDRAMSLAERKPSVGRCTARDDKYTKKARNFLVRWHRLPLEQREMLFTEDPGLYYAYEAWEKRINDPQKTMIIESRLLTTMPYEQIADLCDTLPQTIFWYEALFFNVRDKLHARDWITQQVLVPAMMRNYGLPDNPHHAAEQDDDDNMVVPAPWTREVIARPFLDASLKMFAYFGGPIVCEFMLHGFQSGKLCNSKTALAQYIDEHWAMTLRTRSAQSARTFQINQWNVMELFTIHARIIELAKADDKMDNNASNMEQTITGFISELKDVWCVGDDGKEKVAGTPLAIYDEGAAELRDEEVIAAASGLPVKGVDMLERLKALPAPPLKDNGKAPKPSSTPSASTPVQTPETTQTPK